jgi:hypothetical protein
LQGEAHKQIEPAATIVDWDGNYLHENKLAELSTW